MILGPKRPNPCRGRSLGWRHSSLSTSGGPLTLAEPGVFVHDNHIKFNQVTVVLIEFVTPHVNIIN